MIPSRPDSIRDEGLPSAVSGIAARAYLSRCLRARRAFALVTSQDAGALDAWCRSLVADPQYWPNLHKFYLGDCSLDVAGRVRHLLAAFGHEHIEATPQELHKLLMLFLRHEGSKGYRTLVVLGDATSCSAPVLAWARELAGIKVADEFVVTCLLAGHPGLDRIADSNAMASVASQTRERFDLDHALHRVMPIQAPRPCRAPGVSTGGNCWFVVVEDGRDPPRQMVRGVRFVIGRAADCDIRLPERHVSRHHAALTWLDGVPQVTDLDSANGTWINGKRIRKTSSLADNDLVVIGRCRIRIRQSRS